MLTGLNTDFGVAVNLSWVGATGFLAVEEAISGFEVLKFDPSLAPFNRTTANGSDSANTLLLSINGGGGGGIAKISRDGSTALTRFSSNGSTGAISIRAGTVQSMEGQVASAFGTVLRSVSGSDPLFYNGAALSPDGSTYVLPIPIGNSTTAHDLLLAATTAGATPTNLTNSAASGVTNVNPDISPDGTKIVFARKEASSSTYDLYLINIDGSGLRQLTNTPHFSETNPSWSPDGASVAFSGRHSSGFESDAPALNAGESVNWNIYILTLPPLNIVTPKTTLTEPPLVQVVEQKVTFTFTPFSKAQKSAVKRRIAEMLVKERAAKPAVKYSFRYELIVNKNGGKKKDRREILAKRNQVTIKRLPPGTYTANYRVEILKKEGTKVTTAGRTKFSPRATFSVS